MNDGAGVRPGRLPGLALMRVRIAALGSFHQFRPHGVNHRLVIGFSEDGAAGHKGVGAGRGHARDVVGLDAAVDFEADVLARGVDALARLLDLAQRRFDESSARRSPG
jgi:hypothetical protein